MAPLKDFTQLPAENKFTLDQAYEWHKIHSSHVPAFIYPDDNDQPVWFKNFPVIKRFFTSLY